MKIVKGLLLEYGKETKVVEFDKDDYKELYRLIKCRCFGHGVRKVDNVRYDFWFDDEFLLKENLEYKMTGFCQNASEVILGNLLITKSKDSEIATLEDKDIETLLTNISLVYENENPENVFEVLVYKV